MFGKIKESIDKSLVSVSVKSSTYLEIEKLKTKVMNVSREMDVNASEMGVAVYGQWKDGGVNQEYIEAVCTHMKELEETMAGYRLQIEQLEQEKAKILGKDGNIPEKAGCRGAIVCDCGCMNEPEAKFCISCGKSLVKLEEAVQAAKICPSCGAEAEQGARFCSGCGKSLELG